jgi:hypothetical protein
VNPEFHDQFVALCALFHAGKISDEEWALLQVHMAYCDSCHDRLLQYQRIASEVMLAMAGVMAVDLDHAPRESAEALAAAEQRLLAMVHRAWFRRRSSTSQPVSFFPHFLATICPPIAQIGELSSEKDSSGLRTGAINL